MKRKNPKREKKGAAIREGKELENKRKRRRD